MTKMQIIAEERNGNQKALITYEAGIYTVTNFVSDEITYIFATENKREALNEFEAIAY